jgi:hypothetical protein
MVPTSVELAFVPPCSFANFPGEVVNRLAKGLFIGIACALLAPAWAADAAKDDDKKSSMPEDPNLKPQQVATDNSVTTGGHKIDYKAIAGTIILTGKDENKEDPTASIFYAASRRSASSS